MLPRQIVAGTGIRWSLLGMGTGVGWTERIAHYVHGMLETGRIRGRGLRWSYEALRIVWSDW